MTVTVSS
jgi:hypothetical protein